MRVSKIIQGYEPQVSALSEVGYEIQHALNRALKEVAPRVFENITDGDQRRDALTRFARRRVAAAMDESLSSGGPNLRSWEHYLCPPTSRRLLTGDILWKTEGNRKDPSSYRVVLTPSCDLVAEGERQPNVKTVLAAICSSPERVTSELRLSPSGRKRQMEGKAPAGPAAGPWALAFTCPGVAGRIPNNDGGFSQARSNQSRSNRQRQ